MAFSATRELSPEQSACLRVYFLWCVAELSSNVDSERPGDSVLPLGGFTGWTLEVDCFVVFVIGEYISKFRGVVVLLIEVIERCRED
jgi:hypothetical protein